MTASREPLLARRRPACYRLVEQLAGVTHRMRVVPLHEELLAIVAGHYAGTGKRSAFKWTMGESLA